MIRLRMRRPDKGSWTLHESRHVTLENALALLRQLCEIDPDWTEIDMVQTS